MITIIYYDSIVIMMTDFDWFTVGIYPKDVLGQMDLPKREPCSDYAKQPFRPIKLF